MYDSFSINSKVRGLYYVHFIEQLQSHINNTAANKNVIFVIDDNIASLFKEELGAATAASRVVLINCSEENKTINYCQEVIRKLIEQDVRKNDTLVAVGGGITQDIVTFIASVLFRGVDWKFYPTTLLAQCDSCIGSKSSINFDRYKNLIGTFNPPSEIFIDKNFLETLNESEIRSGIGEMIHYFFSEGIELAQEVSDQIGTLVKDRSGLPYFISNSLRIKKKIIEIDEFDTFIRHIFNYGHTFGHAIEAITKYAIPHGQAITMGMDLANYISLHRNMINKQQFNEMHAILEKNMPAFRFTDENMNAYFEALSKDKKNKGEQLGCILTKGAGKLEKIFLDMDDLLRGFILGYSKEYYL